MWVASNSGNDDDFFFPSLKTVYSFHFNGSFFLDKFHLICIWADYSNVILAGAGIQIILSNAYADICLQTIDDWFWILKVHFAIVLNFWCVNKE